MANVLIVEDAQSVAAAHAYALWDNGHTVTFAYSAREAQEQFRQNRHELVLLDFDLPDGTGLEVFRALREMDPDVCVVMVTGRGDERLATQMLKEGARDYLPKSKEVSRQLPEVVARVLKEKDVERRLAEKDQALRQAHGALTGKVAELAAANEKLHYEIDERIRAEKALKDSNARLTEALEELGHSQAQMLQSEKMASVGQLAAGVAHEINNPTGFISSNLYTLSTYVADIKKFITAWAVLRGQLQGGQANSLPETVRTMLADLIRMESDLELDYLIEDGVALVAECRDGADRIRQIVADLKDFAHPNKLNLESVDINANIDSAINLVWNELKYKAEIIKEFGELPLVPCYPQMISQVMMNLLINAVQAMEAGGTITIGTRKEDAHVVIQVQDTGHGIAEEHLSRIFDPFFTTKPVGQGTGLGLRIVYDIIQKHGGDIRVQSTVGTGSVFTIRLPIDGLEQMKMT